MIRYLLFHQWCLDLHLSSIRLWPLQLSWLTRLNAMVFCHGNPWHWYLHRCRVVLGQCVLCLGRFVALNIKKTSRHIDHADTCLRDLRCVLQLHPVMLKRIQTKESVIRYSVISNLIFTLLLFLAMDSSVPWSKNIRLMPNVSVLLCVGQTSEGIWQ